jgi:hypothetical protein
MEEECAHLLLPLQKVDDGVVESGEALVLVIAAGVVDVPTVKYKAAPVARRVHGQTFFIRETNHLDDKGFVDILNLINVSHNVVLLCYFVGLLFPT